MTMIIGAGAAGLFAAMAISRAGGKPQIFEHQSKVGNKLAVSGGGRCNLTNSGDLLNGLMDTKFLRPALTQFDFYALQAEMAELGINIHSEDNGKCYPSQLNGRDLADRLCQFLADKGADFHYQAKLTDINCVDGKIVQVKINDAPIQCKRLILAPGGVSWPQTGSNGSCWPLLARLGHTVRPPQPALVPIRTQEGWPAMVSGTSLRNIDVSVLIGGKVAANSRGNVLFTHFGLSGPAILDNSWAVAQGLSRRQTIIISLDLLPDLGTDTICRHMQKHAEKTVVNALGELLPRKLAQQLAPDTPVKGLATSTLQKLAGNLKDCRLEAVSTLGMDKAMVTQGGVHLREVNPRTMESKIVSGLFLAGEVLDYHGHTGGFNLHAAFATGWLAGSAITASAPCQ
ncbi:MAG: aminoacetone oxidase family FAD-binding enzyme [Firmicutes bacterium]|nr:aminoacetone oxidase family FAD-binding enzyme [Bacillota bacterium]